MESITNITNGQYTILKIYTNYNGNDIVFQSESNDPESTAITEKETITTFGELNPVVKLEDPQIPDLLTSYTGASDSDLDKFLSRPTVITSFDWFHNADMESQTSPMEAFLQNPVISKKIANYKLLKGNLKIRIVANGMKFHQGQFLIGWKPLGDNTGADTSGITTFDSRRVRVSQLPGPSEPMSVSSNEPIEFSIPFFYPTNYIDLTTIGTKSFDDYGRLHLISLAPLLTANAELVDAHITVYAWLEDYELIVPTIELSFQSEEVKSKKKKKKKKVVNTEAATKAEKTHGPISGVSSAFASAFGELKTVPFVGSYAAAASSMLNKVTDVFTIFGFSRPNLVSTPENFYSLPFGYLANSSGAINNVPLSFDPQQAITTDLSVYNLPDKDHMSIGHIARNWSYLTTFPMLDSQTHGTSIFEMLVTPTYHTNYTIALVDYVQYTSLGFASLFAQKWTGSIEIQFRIIGSSFNTGRLSFSWEPSSANFSAFPDNEQYNYSVDINEQNVVTLSIGYAQAKAFLDVSANRSQATFSTLGIIYNEAISNGALSVKVINPLKGPDPTQTVHIAVFVRAGEDFQLQMPAEAPDSADLATATFNDLHFQSEDIFDSKDYEVVQFGPTSDSSKLPMLYYGEVEVSLRSLIKRFMLYSVRHDEITISLGNSNVNWRAFYDAYPGDAHNGRNVTNTSYLAVCKTAFAGWKGSRNYKTIFKYNDSVVDAAGSTRTRLISPYAEFAIQRDAPSTAGSTLLSRAFTPTGWTGISQTDIDNQAVIQYSLPFYNDIKFCSTLMDPTNPVDDGRVDNSLMIYSTFDAFGVRPFVRTSTYVAAGDDFSLLWFLGGPLAIIDPL